MICDDMLLEMFTKEVWVSLMFGVECPEHFSLVVGNKLIVWVIGHST